MKKDLNIKELWEKYYEGRNKGNGEVYKNLLTEHYRRLIRCVAEKVHKTLPKHIEIDDMISSGTFGLIDAIEDYDNTKKTKFESYACYRIKGSILDGIREEDWVPRIIRYRSNKLKRATRTLEWRFERKPNDKELIEELSKENGEKEAEKIIKDARSLLKRVPLFLKEREVYKKEEDYIEDKNTPNPFIEAQKRDLKEILMRGLTRAEKLIIVLYYYEEMTMKEIGKTLGLEEARISQMHGSIMDRLKTKLDSKKYDANLEMEF